MSIADGVLDQTIEKAEASQFRSQVGQISRQSAVFFSGTVFTAFAAYLFKLYLARVLGAEALGIYALGMTIVGFLGIFNALGLPQSAVRFVAEYNATSQFSLLRGFLVRALGWLTLSNLILAVVVVCAGPWLGKRLYHTSALAPYMVLFAAIMLSGALNTFLGQVLAGYKDVGRRTLIMNFIGSPLMMLLTIALVGLGFGLWGYILAQVAAASAVMVLLLVSCWSFTPKRAKNFGHLPPLEKQVISFSRVAFGVAFLEFVMSQADKVLIGIFLTAKQVGIYALAAGLVAFVPIVLQSVNQIFSPTIAELHARNQHALLEQIYQTLTKWIIGLTIPLAVVIIVFSPAFMKMFGSEFASAWPILVIGTFGQLVNCSVGSVGYLLLMSGNQRSLIRIQAFAGCVMVLMNLMLVPRWGIIGAATAAATTNIFTNVVSLVQVKRTLRMLPYRYGYYRLILPSLVSIVVVLTLRMELLGAYVGWIGLGMSLLLAYAAFGVVSLACGLDANDHLIVDAVRSRLPGRFARRVMETV